ncbi:MAG: hypothetical protein J7500_15620 [Sphingomonas sp.]|uniref:hypothetical protein n=1 Tax=Sphingomonas sp. TaxID=28214 RepID=UPI001B03696B|nr:hypothetical protein [Sphingomonas sp.]MBO9624136.1 hypothetical protein [Sphingomonas sp.]
MAEAESQNGWTPGPWSWFGNARNREIYLATTHSGRRYVMGFRRWGMSGAQPMFQPANRGLVPAERLLTFEVGDREVRGVEQAKANDSVYRLDISGIDCADARLIAAAPDFATIAPDAVELLNRYAAFIRDHVRADDLEMHPYLPEIERVADDLDAALRKARGEAR